MFTAPWSYPEDLVSMVIGEENGNHGIPDNERIVDLTRGPPAYEGNKEYISRLKEDLGIKVNALTGESLHPAEFLLSFCHFLSHTIIWRYIHIILC